VDSFGSLGSLNNFNLLYGRSFAGDFLVDRLFDVLNRSRLVLFEDFLRRSEGVDRLRRRRARKILVRVEATNRSDIGNVGQLEEIVLLLAELTDALIAKVLREEAWLVCLPVLTILSVPFAIVVSAVVVTAAMLQSELFRHRRKSDSLGQVRKWIDEAALLILVVVEAAAVAKLAGAGLGPVLARNGLVVGVDGAERCLSEILGKRIIRLSELFLAMGKLAVFIERA